MGALAPSVNQLPGRLPTRFEEIARDEQAVPDLEWSTTGKSMGHL
jgi:hypothetical protein